TCRGSRRGPASARPAARSRTGSPTCWTSTAPASPRTRPARPRWSPSTWRAPRCARARPPWRSPAGSTSSPRPASPWSSTPFDATANGYVRGEGAGVVVLKRLADARRDGDRVLATIRGSAVSHDGRTNGIMAPNGEAQAHVARLALRQAGIAATSVGYVEAHGTGTRLGDPIEAAALSSVYGAHRPADQPCLIGSVKSNIGHLEAAAGVAGLMKAVLVLQHQEIPPQAGFGTPNPAVPWDESGLRVTQHHTPWQRTGHP